MFKKLFCKHEYSLYESGEKYIDKGCTISKCYTWTFICPKCEQELKITEEWIKEKLYYLREQQRKNKFLGKSLPEESTLRLNKPYELAPKYDYGKDRNTYIGSHVTEFIQELRNMGIDYKDLER